MIRLYDTMSRSIRPLEKGTSFGYYCCGPTVYGPAHIGNFRTFLVQDVLRRLLDLEGYNPTHVRNITDVDDKTIRQSQKEGVTLQAFTERWAAQFHRDCLALNIVVPHHEPRPTHHIEQQIKLIQRLIEKGNAYVGGDGVYYRIASFPSYGRLAQLEKRNNVTQAFSSSGGQNHADEYDRESVCDFALWKFKKPEDGANAWDSPWGAGRPGWHIECSAMAMHYLGDSVDLHGGGVDLCFPHHENEIAQAEPVTGQPFVKHWFHAAHLMVDGAKMSKSLGNLYTLADIEGRGFAPVVLRYTLLAGHYRQPLNFTLGSLYASQSALLRMGKLLLPLVGGEIDLAQRPVLPEKWSFLKAAWEALTNDINIPAALGQFFKTLGGVASLSSEEAKIFVHESHVLLYGLGLLPLESKHAKEIPVPASVAALAEERWAAKNAKNFERADHLRLELGAAGWAVADHKEGYDLYPKSDGAAC